VRYTVTLSPPLHDFESWVVECNCSICARNGYLNVYVQNSCIEFQSVGLDSDLVEVRYVVIFFPSLCTCFGVIRGMQCALLLPPPPGSKQIPVRFHFPSRKLKKGIVRAAFQLQMRNELSHTALEGTNFQDMNTDVNSCGALEIPIRETAGSALFL
jgi:hypothetical protein